MIRLLGDGMAWPGEAKGSTGNACASASGRTTATTTAA